MTSVVQYFNGEKLRCYTGIGIAFVSLAAALSFLSIPSLQSLSGVAYPFIGIAILELMICGAMLPKTSNNINRVSNIFQNQPERLRIEEFPRMRKVLKTLMLVKIFTVFLAMMGLLMVLLIGTNSITAGVGLGLLIQAVLIYSVDHVAIKSGLLYWTFLQTSYKSHQVKVGFKCFPLER
jgi:hypothetical protein